jgi:hypothetical protein
MAPAMTATAILDLERERLIGTLEAALAEARKPLLLRVIEGLRRKPAT